MKSFLKTISFEDNGCLTIFVENTYFQRIATHIYLIMSGLNNLNIPKTSFTTKIIRQPTFFSRLIHNPPDFPLD